MKSAPAKENGLRARKRRETRQRIAEAGLKLFVRKGYEATTLEAIVVDRIVQSTEGPSDPQASHLHRDGGGAVRRALRAVAASRSSVPPSG